jgi:hypothetical protein
MNERELRRDEFHPDSHPIEMADGQKWHFPRPRVRFATGFGGGRANVKTWVEHWDGFMDLLEEAARMPEGTGDWVSAHLSIAANMLLRNYDLSDQQLDELFGFETIDDLVQLILEVSRVAAGQSPKPSGDGSESPC